MISEVVFFVEFALIMERFGRNLNPETQGRYLDFLNEQGMSEADFRLAARVVFTKEKFFPAPQTFLDVLHGDAEVQALEAWARIMERLASGAEFLTDVQSLERSVLNVAANGNASHVRTMTYQQLEWTKKEFIKLFAHRLEQKILVRQVLPAVSPTISNRDVPTLVTRVLGRVD